MGIPHSENPYWIKYPFQFSIFPRNKPTSFQSGLIYNTLYFKK